MQLPTNALIGIGMAIGAAQCFFGYRAFKLLLVLVGFVLGYMLAFAAVEALFQHRFAAFLAGIVVGIVCGSMINNVYLIGVFIVSGIFGGAVALHLYTIAGQHPEPAMLFIFAVLGGLLALFFQKLMIVLATAFTGSWGVVAGVTWFSTALFNPTSLLSVEAYFRSGGTQAYIVIACWLALGTLGALFQYKRLPGMHEGYDSSVDPPK